jgi:ProP effector
VTEAPTTPTAPTKAAAKEPRPRGPHPLLHRLAELYPQLFGARFLPLKLGFFEEVMQRHPGEFDKAQLKIALGQHARSSRYLEAVAAGHQRHGLDGQPVEDVAPEHRHHAIMEVFRRRQARAPKDIRPWLVDRLAEAIRDSGLDREAYLERIRTSDEAALQALHEAFDALGEQAARREALRRAYEASGRSVAEFAQMYGLEPAAVEAALADGKA